MATILRNLLAAGAAAALVVGISGCGGDVDQSDHDAVVDELEALKSSSAVTAEELRTEIARLRGELATARDNSADEQTISDLNDEIDELQGVLDEAEANAKSEMAKKILAALNRAGGDAPNPVTPGSFLTALLWGSSGQVMQEASSSGELTTKAFGYTMSEDMMVDPIENWRGSVLTRGKEEVHVYTDIEDATPTPFHEVYMRTNSPGDPVAYTLSATVEAGTATENNIPWSAARRDDTMAGTSGSGATMVTTFSGTVDDVPGTFSCTGEVANCSPPVAGSRGELTSTQNWTFSPSSSSATIDVMDGEYLIFGWWLNETPDGDFEFHAFSGARGMTPVTATELVGNTMVGSATYKGGAAGKWAMANALDSTNHGGHFTADATITADFDADADDDITDGNDRDGVLVSGMIDNFMIGGESRDWTVTLTSDADAAADGVQTADNAALVSPTTSWDLGGGVTGTGAWSLAYHRLAADATTPPSHPDAVTGEFDAAIAGGEIGQIVGAFGASLMEDE